MNRKTKRKRMRSRDLASGGKGAPSTIAPSVSGAYIHLSREGGLQRLSQLRAEYAKLKTDLSATVESLRQCNNPDWLDEFSKRVHRRGKNFEAALRRRTEELERHKTKTAARVEKVRQEINGFGVSLPQGPFTTLAAPVQAWPSSPTRQRSGDNQFVFLRDLTIRKHANLSIKQICKKLDAELMQGEGMPPIGYPESWRERFGVSTFTDAYIHNAKSRNLVQKLIWKAKQST